MTYYYILRICKLKQLDGVCFWWKNTNHRRHDTFLIFLMNVMLQKEEGLMTGCNELFSTERLKGFSSHCPEQRRSSTNLSQPQSRAARRRPSHSRQGLSSCGLHWSDLFEEILKVKCVTCTLKQTDREQQPRWKFYMWQELAHVRPEIVWTWTGSGPGSSLRLRNSPDVNLKKGKWWRLTRLLFGFTEKTCLMFDGLCLWRETFSRPLCFYVCVCVSVCGLNRVIASIHYEASWFSFTLSASTIKGSSWGGDGGSGTPRGRPPLYVIN